MHNDYNKTHTGRHAFASYHPVITLCYFLLVTAVTVLTIHPIYLLISLIGALRYALVIDGTKKLRFTILGLLPMMLVVMIINPLVHHGGITVLGYLPSGNPLTLESILFGLSAAMLMAAMVLWFRCYMAVMTSDKVLYLFGRVVPALSLILSMTLRFVPLFYRQFLQIREAQRGLSRESAHDSMLERIRHGIKLLSILMTWALEHAIETADSMKSRGYGLSGRTAFSIFRFEKRDSILLLWMMICTGYMVIAAFSGAFAWQYYPVIKGVFVNIWAIGGYACFFVLCLMPVYLEKREERIWKQLQQDYLSNI